MRSNKMWISIMLMTIALLLTGCNRKGQSEKSKIDNLNEGLLTYQREQIQLNLPFRTLDGACFIDETAYFMGITQAEGREEFSLFQVLAADGTSESLPGYEPVQFPEGVDAYPVFCKLRPANDGSIWSIEQFVTISEQTGSNVLLLRQLNSAGQEVYRLEMKGLDDYQDICSSMDGTVLVNQGGGISFWDSNAKMQSKLDGQNIDREDFFILGDGRIGILMKSNDSCSLKTIDSTAMTWGESFSLPSTVSRVYHGGGDALFYFLDGDILYLMRAGSDAGEPVLNWSNCSIDGRYVLDFSFLDDGRIEVLARGSNGPELFMLTPSASQAEKIELTLGAVGVASNLRKMVLEFNNSNSLYHISVVDYEQGGVSHSQATTRLATEIVTGNMPDIVCLDGLSSRSLETSGYLENLWPYIDEDPALGRENLMLRPLQAAEVGGSLYRISDSFTIRTVAGSKETLGDKTGWTTADVEAALASMPDGCTAWGHFGTKQDMLFQTLYNTDRFIDWDRGVCNFDSEEFKSILAYCNSFPDTVAEDTTDPHGYAAICNRQQMLLPVSVSSPLSVVQDQTLFRNNVTYIGYPTNDKNTGSWFQLPTALAISSSCANKSGAWEFLRTMLLPRENIDPLHSFGLPINRKDFEQLMDLAMLSETYEENPTRYILLRNGNYEISYEGRAITLEEREQLLDLYDRSTGLFGLEDSIINIVTEQAGAYFAGDRSLDDTVAAIQSRVGLYLAELQ